MEMHRRLRLARGARGKSQQRDVVPAGLHGVEPDRLVQRHPIELGVMVRGAVEIHDLLEEFAGLGAGDQFVGDAAVGQRQRDLGLVDDFCQFTGAQHRHGVDDDGAGFGRCQPCRHQSGIVAGADQHAVAGLDAVILHQRMRQAVRPVGEFLVGALAAVADQRRSIAEPLLDNAVGQFDRGIEIFGVLKFRPVENQFRPCSWRRQISPREIIDMPRWAKFKFLPDIFHRPRVGVKGSRPSGSAHFANHFILKVIWRKGPDQGRPIFFGS